MKVMERNVMRLVAVQHLRTAYGIKTKNWNKNKTSSSKSTANTTVSLESCVFPITLTKSFVLEISGYRWTWYCLVFGITLAYY